MSKTRVNSFKVNLAEIVDLDDMIKSILYCDECGLMDSKFAPDNYVEEMICNCETVDDGDDEYLYW